MANICFFSDLKEILPHGIYWVNLLDCSILLPDGVVGSSGKLFTYLTQYIGLVLNLLLDLLLLPPIFYCDYTLQGIEAEVVAYSSRPNCNNRLQYNELEGHTQDGRTQVIFHRGYTVDLFLGFTRGLALVRCLKTATYDPYTKHQSSMFSYYGII